MLNVIAAGLGAIGGIFKGFFGFKSEQANVVQELLKLGSNVTDNNAKVAIAAATVIVAENNSGGLSKHWRPLLMVVFCGIIISSWFGFVPPHLEQDMGPMMSRIFDIVEIGVMGYIPGRSLEKIVSGFARNKALMTLIEKKLF